MFFRFDVVPGLVSKDVTFPGTVQKRCISCIGDEEKIDSKRGSYFLPVRPSVEVPLAMRVLGIELHCPGRVDMEHRMNVLIAKNLSSEVEARVVSRQLKIGALDIVVCVMHEILMKILSLRLAQRPYSFGRRLAHLFLG